MTQITPNKVTITIRLRPSTVTFYREMGRGWQTRMSADLDLIAEGSRLRQKPTTTKRKK